MIEDEFFDIESFRNRKDFFSKVNTYQNFFNLARKNGSRNYKSPLELLTEKASSLNPEILCLPVLDLDLALSSLPVHHVPSLVENYKNLKKLSVCQNCPGIHGSRTTLFMLRCGHSVRVIPELRTEVRTDAEARQIQDRSSKMQLL
ncbi:MAG: hypothetical protein P8123_00680 [bacterium]